MAGPTDTPGSALVLFSELGLVISLIAFTALSIRTFSRRHRADQDRARMLPLEEDRPARRHEDTPHE